MNERSKLYSTRTSRSDSINGVVFSVMHLFPRHIMEFKQSLRNISSTTLSPGNAKNPFVQFNLK